MNLLEDKMNLGLTKVAAGLYFDFPHTELQELVRACAKQDWGDGTECVFKDGKIVVEHLDGRLQNLLSNDVE
jgi:hypothetical protein